MNIDKYVNTVEYPKYVQYRCLECGTEFDKDKFFEGHYFCSKCGNNNDLYYVKELMYENQLRRYYKEEIRIQEEFKKDALESFNLENHPKKDFIFGKAFEQGHYAGYSEIYNKLDNIVEFLQDIEYLK